MRFAAAGALLLGLLLGGCTGAWTLSSSLRPSGRRSRLPRTRTLLASLPPPPPSPPPPPPSRGDKDGDGSWTVVPAWLRTEVRRSRKPDVALKNLGFLLTYYGITVNGELALRLTSFLAIGCSYGSNLLKWPKIYWSVILLQTGLIIRAARLTIRVARDALDFRLNPREVHDAQFVSLSSDG
jgi:hypothetical protein